MMFNKVLIAEDLDTISIGISKALEELGLTNFQHVKYCDDAYLKIKKALNDNNAFDLLITDLSFLTDTRFNKATLSSGEELIAAVLKIQPNIKVIAFSVEDKPYRIKSLFDRYKIAGFVAKGRNSIPELQKAILAVSKSEKTYISAEFSHVLQGQPVNEVDEIDRQILKLLSDGKTVEQIATKFKDWLLAPSSTSSIEKKINKLKLYFGASNSTHLVSLAKDLGMI